MSRAGMPSSRKLEGLKQGTVASGATMEVNRLNGNIRSQT
jgi:hypothetical protein